MAVAPAYRRIADEYARRIVAGELAPGDRLPSVRNVAEEWGVALATAARALSELSRSGLTRTQERVGSVVTPTTAPGRPPLGRPLIVTTAVAIADAEGLDAVTVRSVAARLGASPMALYRHIDNKDALLMSMADLAYGEDTYRPPLPQDWRTRLELVARTLWQLYRRHPWLALLGPLARPLPVPNLLRHGETMLSALDGLGLDAARALEVQIVLFAHGQGLATNLEQEERARGATGVTEVQWEDVQVPVLRAIAAGSGLANMSALMDGLSDGYDFDLDAIFEIGLQALLDGFNCRIHREGRRVAR